MTATRAQLVPAKNEGNRADGPIPLGDDRVSVGRGPSNTHVLDDREVSKHHAELICDGANYWVVDLNSSNGTYVNGEAIARRMLAEQDNIEFGSCTYVFTLQATGQVTILPQSPIDKTQVLASSMVESFVPAKELGDPEEVRRSYKRVRTAFEAVRQLVASTDVEQLCQEILRVTFELVDAETGAVLLFDDDGNLHPWSTRYNRAEGEGELVISRTIVDQVLRDHCAVLASDALQDHRWSATQSMVLSGMRSLMAVPLASGDDVFGIIHVGHSREVGMFTEEDLELVSGVGAGAAVALKNALMTARLSESVRAREQLGRFLSPVLVDQVLSQSLELKRGGEEREVTLLFTDIRGFTKLTEQTEAKDIVSMLNEYFDQMVEIVFKHGGVLDKFIGDAVMAVWGTPVGQPDDAGRAIAAAKEMLETLDSLNSLRVDRDLFPIEIGLGLASGPCVAGNIGARRRMEYTVIGNAVNLAARFCGMAQAGEILSDEETYRRAGNPDGATHLEAASVKGFSQPVPVVKII